MAELADWIREGYAPAFKTACLILGNSSDAEEAVQEAFLRAWRFRDSISDNQGNALKPWLYRVVVNTCISKLRKEIPHRDRRAPETALDHLSDSKLPPDQEGDRLELATEMLKSLSSLPDHLRITLVLRYYVGLSEREIAMAIKKRPGTVKSRLHEGRRLLSEIPALQLLASEWLAVKASARTSELPSIEEEMN